MQAALTHGTSSKCGLSLLIESTRFSAAARHVAQSSARVETKKILHNKSTSLVLVLPLSPNAIFSAVPFWSLSDEEVADLALR